MLSYSDLISCKRYLFYEKKCNDDTKIITITADFIDIINNTIRLKKYCYSDNIINNHMITMPIEWIIQIEKIDNYDYSTSLHDILIEI